MLVVIDTEMPQSVDRPKVPNQLYVNIMQVLKGVEKLEGDKKAEGAVAVRLLRPLN